MYHGGILKKTSRRGAEYAEEEDEFVHRLNLITLIEKNTIAQNLLFADNIHVKYIIFGVYLVISGTIGLVFEIKDLREKSTHQD